MTSITDITIIDSDLTENELWIAYSINGEEDKIILEDANEIAQLFKDACAVEDYKIRDGLLCVSVERNFPATESRLEFDAPCWITWEDFLPDFSFSQHTCIWLVKEYEDRKLIQEKLIAPKDEMFQAIENMNA